MTISRQSQIQSLLRLASYPVRTRPSSSTSQTPGGVLVHFQVPPRAWQAARTSVRKAFRRGALRAETARLSMGPSWTRCAGWLCGNQMSVAVAILMVKLSSSSQKVGSREIGG